MTSCIPTFVAESIFTSDKTFFPEEVEKFRSSSVQWLQCGGHSEKYTFCQSDTSNPRSDNMSQSKSVLCDTGSSSEEDRDTGNSRSENKNLSVLHLKSNSQHNTGNCYPSESC